jgi:hypothetical protein
MAGSEEEDEEDEEEDEDADDDAACSSWPLLARPCPDL